MEVTEVNGIQLTVQIANVIREICNNPTKELAMVCVDPTNVGYEPVLKSWGYALQHRTQHTSMMQCARCAGGTLRHARHHRHA